MKSTYQSTRSAFRRVLPFLVAVTTFGAILPGAQAQTTAELAEEIRAMKQRITELETKLATAEEKATSAQAQAASAQASVSQVMQGAPAPGGKGVVAPEYPIAVTEDGWWQRTHIGGYGEMHLNLGDKEQIDYHRYVLYIDHHYNDRISFISELELEHSLAGEGKNGEVELEQAYVNFDLGNGFGLKTGLFLIPVGILNERHEPNTFFGTERNFVEAEIIPTTWWEGGVALTKAFDNGLSFDLAGHSALDVPADGSNAYRVRSGRQKVSEAAADEWATTFRARYVGIPGIELAGSLQYQSDLTQTTALEDNHAWLASTHATWQVGGFAIRALYGYWDIAGPTPAALGLDEQYGFYVEPSYTFNTAIGDLGFFARWSQLDAENLDSDIYDVGVNYWPIDNVVFKLDYTRVEETADDDFINVGMGFQF